MSTHVTKWNMREIESLCDKLRFPRYVLSISHSDYRICIGGTEKVLHEEQSEFRRLGISYVQLFPVTSGNSSPETQVGDQLIGVNIDSTPIENLTITQFGLILQVLNIKGNIKPSAIHLHHMMNFSLPGLMFLLWSAGCARIRVFIHDYYMVCTDFNLLKNGREYCGDHFLNAGFCETCERHGGRGRHMEGIRALLKEANPEIVAPSPTAASVWGRYFKEYATTVRVVPHQRVIPAVTEDSDRADRLERAGYRPRIAYLGYESLCKGIETWWRLVKNEEIRKKFRLYHLGATGSGMPGVTYIPVSFLQDGPNAMIHALKENRIDIAFLWSIWPETYSFTLFEALAANCFIVTNRLSGNIAARVRNEDRGVVFADEAELFSYLHDLSQVRKDLSRCFQHHFPAELVFNPQLAVETAQACKEEDACGGRTFQKKDACPDSFLSSWCYLMQTADKETRGLKSDRRLLHELAELKKELSVYQISRAHRVVEAVRLRIAQDSRFGANARKVIHRVFDRFQRRRFDGKGN